MILWTIQDARVMDALARDGVYTVDPANLYFAEYEDNDVSHLNYAYRWLCGQMVAHVGPPPAGVQYPLWATYKKQGRHDGKPDMRTHHRYSQVDEVRLKLDVPDWEVLLTDYDDWHHVLNYWYLSEGKADEDAFQEHCKECGVTMHDYQDWSKVSDDLVAIRRRIEKSWERCIGVTPRDTDWHFPWFMRSIQATFWQLKAEYVLSVENFKARQPTRERQ